MENKTKVTFNADSEIYAMYKKVMIDKRTTPTADLNRYMKALVEEANKSRKENE